MGLVSFRLGLVGMCFLVVLGCAGEKRASVGPRVGGGQKLHGVQLLVKSGPNMKEGVEELGSVFEGRTGVKVAVEGSDPRSAIEWIRMNAGADLFVCHDPFEEVARRQGVGVEKGWTVATLEPVIVVAKGNPKGIRGLRDLGRAGVRVGLTERGKTISGNIVDVMLGKAGVTEAVEKNVVLRRNAGRDLAAALVAREIDAGIVWSAVIYGFREEVEGVAIEREFHPDRGQTAENAELGTLRLDRVEVKVLLLSGSSHQGEAKAFAELLASGEGEGVFLRKGFGGK